MMNKVYTSAVVIIPPQKSWAPIQEIRKIYDRNVNRWMPHITLLYPFRPENEYMALEKKFSEVCKIVPAFEVTLQEFHYFNHGRQSYTLWIKPEPFDKIQDLQAKILKLIPDCNDMNNYKNGFNPHLSVGQIKGKNNLLEITKNFEDRWKIIKFFLSEIFFISREQNKTSRFEIKKRIQLRIE